MDRFSSLARKLVEAAALGLLATSVLYVPPASIATRLDSWLFDISTRLAPPQITAGIVAVGADTAADVAAIAAQAEAAGARIIVSTLPLPPELASPKLIMPVADPLGARSPEDSHLWLQPELDGVVRRDLAVSVRGRELPSIALRAAKLLGADIDGSHSRALLRWPKSDALQVLSTPLEAAELTGRIVVVGPMLPAYPTPLGLSAGPEVVAQLISSHWRGDYVAESWPAEVGTWALALALGLPFLRARATRLWGRLVLLSCAALLLPVLSATALHVLDLWLPSAGPTAWLLLTGALLIVRARTPRLAIPVAANNADPLVSARGAAAAGELRGAWALYRQVPHQPSLLPEMYDLACTLWERGAHDEAADLFHRIVQVDGGFRDVAHRLVRASRSQGERDEVVRIPSSIGRYELLELIGSGAMGNVYLGRDPMINRILALKAIDLRLGYDDQAGLDSTTESFLREATIAGSLSHPNIVTIFDVGECDSLAYIAMEYVRGHHLSEFAAAGRLLPVTTVLDLIARTADTLDYAHRHNVVHRDIKPANIMYDSLFDNLKVTDFGIAKLIDVNRTRTGIVLGTPAFMSPEQLEGKNVNGHTDLFALGVSLYQLLTGQLPFRGASMTSLMFVIANEPHPPVTSVRGDLPQWLDEVMDKALAKNPADRFESGAEMAAALRRAA